MVTIREAEEQLNLAQQTISKSEQDIEKERADISSQERELSSLKYPARTLSFQKKYIGKASTGKTTQQKEIFVKKREGGLKELKKAKEDINRYIQEELNPYKSEVEKYRQQVEEAKKAEQEYTTKQEAYNYVSKMYYRGKLGDIWLYGTPLQKEMAREFVSEAGLDKYPEPTYFDALGQPMSVDPSKLTTPIPSFKAEDIFNLPKTPEPQNFFKEMAKRTTPSYKPEPLLYSSIGGGISNFKNPKSFGLFETNLRTQLLGPKDFKKDVEAYTLKVNLFNEKWNSSINTTTNLFSGTDTEYQIYEKEYKELEKTEKELLKKEEERKKSLLGIFNLKYNEFSKTSLGGFVLTPPKPFSEVVDLRKQGLKKGTLETTKFIVFAPFRSVQLELQKNVELIPEDLWKGYLKAGAKLGTELIPTTPAQAIFYGGISKAFKIAPKTSTGVSTAMGVYTEVTATTPKERIMGGIELLPLGITLGRRIPFKTGIDSKYLELPIFKGGILGKRDYFKTPLSKTFYKEGSIFYGGKKDKLLKEYLVLKPAPALAKGLRRALYQSKIDKKMERARQHILKESSFGFQKTLLRADIKSFKKTALYTGLKRARFKRELEAKALEEDKKKKALIEFGFEEDFINTLKLRKKRLESFLEQQKNSESLLSSLLQKQKPKKAEPLFKFDIDYEYFKKKQTPPKSKPKGVTFKIEPPEDFIGQKTKGGVQLLEKPKQILKEPILKEKQFVILSEKQILKLKQRLKFKQSQKQSQKQQYMFAPIQLQSLKQKKRQKIIGALKFRQSEAQVLKLKQKARLLEQTKMAQPQLYKLAQKQILKPAIKQIPKPALSLKQRDIYPRLKRKKGIQRGQEKKVKKGSNQKKGYTPSFTAISFNIKGTKPSKILGGYAPSIRPILD